MCAQALAVATLWLLNPAAQAVPNFAAQTGQPCTACHIGGYGPQLTPLGRAFKIGGYTQSGGEGWEASVPLSAMVLTSFTHTGNDVPDDQITPHYAANNNFALDQISVFRGQNWRPHGRLCAVHLLRHSQCLTSG